MHTSLSLLSLDQEILRHLEKDKILVFTPSRRVQVRRVVCYDDREIVKLAYESDGIIVSNDNYRDLANEKTEWKKFIDERLLMYTFVNDKYGSPTNTVDKEPITISIWSCFSKGIDMWISDVVSGMWLCPGSCLLMILWVAMVPVWRTS